MSILNSFPAADMYGHQREILLRIEKAFTLGNKRVVVLQAPVGCGKSLIHYTVASWLGSGYLATPQKMLVQQMADDRFMRAGVNVLKGRTNYSCLLRYKKRNRLPPVGGVGHEEPYSDMSCGNNAPCQTKKNYPCEFRVISLDHPKSIRLSDEPKLTEDAKCYYYSALYNAIHRPIAVLPLAMLLAARRVLPTKEVVVVDEAQSLENWIQKFVSCTVKDLHGKPPETIEVALKILEKAIHEATITEFSLEEESINRELMPDEIEQLNYCKSLTTNGSGVLSDARDGRRWVTYIHLHESNAYSIEFKPVFVANYGELVFGMGHKAILSSATLFPFKDTVKWLGIRPEECEFIDVPSVFPPENIEIVNACIGRMSKQYIEANMPAAVQRVRDILDREKGVRGIIHAHSYLIARALKEQIGAPYISRLVFHKTEDRNVILKRWLTYGTGDSVLVAVSMTEGLDLHDDLAQFQVLMKAPYGDLSDPVVAARLEAQDGREWYNTTALRTILQASGRASRHAADVARFYILDSNVLVLVATNKDKIPKWFADSWRLTKPFAEIQKVKETTIF